MKLSNLTRAALGVALAAVIPLATVGASVTHAGTNPTIHIGTNPTISATWHNHTLTVSGTGFDSGDTVDLGVYNGLPSSTTPPLASAVVTAHKPTCSGPAIGCTLANATIATTITTLNPGACTSTPGGVSFLPVYQVLVYDQTAGTAGKIVTVYPGCGTGTPTAPQSSDPEISASLNATTGVISMHGQLVNSHGPVGVALLEDGRPLSTVQTTASASFNTGVIGCGNHIFTVVAVDEASHHWSNYVSVSDVCFQ